jgi:hypothetical protein
MYGHLFGFEGMRMGIVSYSGRVWSRKEKLI